jgi:hypothetical protein
MDSPFDPSQSAARSTGLQNPRPDISTSHAYSWEHLPAGSRREVEARVRRASGQRRSRLIAALVFLLLLLLVIAGVGVLVFAVVK